MHKTLIFLVSFFASTALNSAPFITKEMMKRNGLTDEQYERLWSVGKNPKVDIGAIRDWMYRASRYDNVTDWLATIGKTNNYAALAARVPKLIEENEGLVSTNSFLLKSRDEWRVLAESWYNTATNQQARHDRIVNWATTQRDKAILPTTKELWQGLIDKLNEDYE